MTTKNDLTKAALAAAMDAADAAAVDADPKLRRLWDALQPGDAVRLDRGREAVVVAKAPGRVVLSWKGHAVTKTGRYIKDIKRLGAGAVRS